MALTSTARQLLAQITLEGTKLGDLRKIAKEVKRNHDVAMELWGSGSYYARMLALLIMDKKLISQEFIDSLDRDIQQHELEERNQLTDWLMAKQLTKSKKTILLMESWREHPSVILRRIYWYYQARLRWSTKTPPNNAADLLVALEKDMAEAEPEVQWAMNFTVCQIGVNEPAYRAQCIALGEKHGLYKDEPVSKGCTPNYIPEWIRIEVAKLSK
ncbi:MAG: DNA alkylation repair protein [Bacteroidota bacterium]